MALIVGVVNQLPEVERTYGTIGANDTTVRDALVYVRELVEHAQLSDTIIEDQKEIIRRELHKSEALRSTVFQQTRANDHLAGKLTEPAREIDRLKREVERVNLARKLGL